MKLRARKLEHKAIRKPYIYKPREYTPEEVAAHKAYIERREAERNADFAEWIKTNAGKYDPEFEEHTMFDVDRRMAEYRAEGTIAVFAGIDWVCPIEVWMIYREGSIMQKSETAISMTLPLSLNTEATDFVNIRIESYKREADSEKDLNLDANGRTTWLEKECRIEGKIGGDMFRGTLLIDPITEMTAYFVIMAPGTSQHVADALAAPMKRIMKASLPTDLPALLQPSDRCFICNRPLTDPVSKVLMIGPSCAEAAGVKHDHEAAKAALARRAAFWAGGEVQS